ncbi:hypothetical protein M1466_03870 [Candidatus Dependentiae bacterium]|nr:hypothetical protein [Candidatus Dependentiae bacterium]
MNTKKCINCHSNILLTVTVLMTIQGAQAGLWGTISSGFKKATNTISGALHTTAQQAEHAAQQLSPEAAEAFSNARGTLQQTLQHIRVSNINSPKRPAAPPPLSPQTVTINIFDPATFPANTERYNIAYVFAIPANPSSVFSSDIVATMNSVAKNNQTLIVNVPGAPFSLVRLDDNGNPINIDGSQPMGTMPTVASFDTIGQRILAADGQEISYLLVPALPSNSAAFLTAVNNLLSGSITQLAKSIYLFEPGYAYVYMRHIATYEEVTAPVLMMASRGVITPAPGFPGDPFGASSF